MTELPLDYYDLMPVSPKSRLDAQLNSKFYISRNDFCADIDSFFEIYGKGSFSTKASDSDSKKIFVSPMGFSFIVKRIIGLLPSPDELKILIGEENGILYIDFEMDTSSIENLLFKELCRLASRSGMGFIMKPHMLTLTAEIISSDSLNVYAGKERIVFTALESTIIRKNI